MTEPSTYTMSQEDKNKIRELLFQRVPDAATRTKIFQLAASLGDVENGGDDYYWSSLYHYALPEKRSDMEMDHKEYFNDYSFFDTGNPEKVKKNG